MIPRLDDAMMLCDSGKGLRQKSSASVARTVFVSLGIPRNKSEASGYKSGTPRQTRYSTTINAKRQRMTRRAYRNSQRRLKSVRTDVRSKFAASSTPNPICCGDSGGRARYVTKPYKNYVVQILESELVQTHFCKAASQ